MTIHKKLLAFVLILCMITVNIIPSFAEGDSFTSDLMHVHNWKYTANGATVTASCNVASPSECDVTDLTLTISASNAEYDGAPHPATFEESSFLGNTELPSITYFVKGVGGEYDTIADAPKYPGEYKASFTAGSVTASVSYTISPRTLTISGTTVNDKVYDGTTDVEAFIGTVSGIIAGDNVTVSMIGADFDTPEVGVNKTVTITYVLSGDDADNYKKPNNDVVHATIHRELTVTFETNGGSTMEPQIVLNWTPVDEPAENPTKTGFAFDGWYTDNTFATAFDFTNEIEDSITIYAKWVPEYTVTFDAVGGSSVEAQTVVQGDTAEKPANNPTKIGFTFAGWYTDSTYATAFDFTAPITADTTIYAKWQQNKTIYTILWKDYDGKELAKTNVEKGKLPEYPLSTPTRSGYTFKSWDKTIVPATADAIYTATYQLKSSGGGVGGRAASTEQKTTATYSQNWYTDENGAWKIRNSNGETVVNAWLCDDAITANGQNVWYLLSPDGSMTTAGLIQDNTGNYYSLELEHNGYYGMLRYQDGTYNCNGQSIYLSFNQAHNGSFGAIVNEEGLEKLKSIYGVTQFGIGNENSVYTNNF